MRRVAVERNTVKTVGITEARKRWLQLVDEVAAGETVVITRRGQPIAWLTPPPHPTATRRDPAEVVRDLKELRANITLGGLSIRELQEEGRD